MTDSVSPQSTPAASGRAVSGLLLSVAAVPFLAGIVVEKLLTSGLRELGLLSEELFRGDRLPLVTPPPASGNPEAAPPNAE